MGDWTRRAAPNGQGRVQFNLQQSIDPVVRVETTLTGGPTPWRDSATGTDLRKVAGIYFPLPPVPGSYKLTVSAFTAAGCVDGVDRPMTVIVQ